VNCQRMPPVRTGGGSGRAAAPRLRGATASAFGVAAVGPPGNANVPGEHSATRGQKRRCFIGRLSDVDLNRLARLVKPTGGRNTHPASLSSLPSLPLSAAGPGEEGREDMFIGAS
jgi:hypothetical protein